MNGSNAAIVPYLEQAVSPYAGTVGQHISKSELVDNIAREFSETQRLQLGLGAQATIAVAKEDVSPSSESCLDIAGLFPEKLPKPMEARYTFSVLQEWEGYVLSIAKDTFTARLVDVTMGSSHEEEEADFPLDDLEDVDRSRIRGGAIFRWIIGYRRGPGGTKGRESRIVFRNLPAWTWKELERNRREAADWASALREE
jgi:hypothetical protein